MTDGSLKPTRHYPVISIDVSALRGGERAFEVPQSIIEALGAAGGKALKLRAFGRETAIPDEAGRPTTRTYVYLVTPRGGGGLASALVAALNAAWPGAHVRTEGSLPPIGSERLLFQADGSVVHVAPSA
jgi:hypothetical protein